MRASERKSFTSIIQDFGLPFQFFPRTVFALGKVSLFFFRLAVSTSVAISGSDSRAAPQAEIVIWSLSSAFDLGVRPRQGNLDGGGN